MATEDPQRKVYQLHEVYFTDPKHITVRGPNPLFQFSTTAGPHIGMAGFSSCDGLRHATVGGADGSLHEVSWSGSVNPTERKLTTQTQFQLPAVAGIAGFFDPSTDTRDVIVAMQGGDVFDVHYGGRIMAGGQIIADRVTTFSPTPPLLVNVAAFVDTDTNRRHVIALDDAGHVTDYSYTPWQVFGETLLYTQGNKPEDKVVDLVAYYSPYDYKCHVILATRGGKVHEVYYS